MKRLAGEKGVPARFLVNGAAPFRKPGIFQTAAAKRRQGALNPEISFFAVIKKNPVAGMAVNVVQKERYVAVVARIFH